MFFVDRAVAIIQPQKPFLDWLLSVEPHESVDITLEQLQHECTTFLIPQYNEPEEAIAYIDDIYLSLFQIELSGWYEDPDLWPEDMSLQAFWEMFDVRVHAMVIDTVESDLHNTPILGTDIGKD